MSALHICCILINEPGGIVLSRTVSEREKIVVRTSFVGIGANIVLVIFKAMIGIAVNSIAVILDAVNNLTDVLSSTVTIIGTKLANREPTKKHPYGYGRLEYMSQLIVAALILYAGITSAVESVKKLIYPESADYNTLSMIIIASAVVVKLALGLYVRKKGKEVSSGTLVASGTDALFDAVISVSVLVSAAIYLIFGLSLEAYVGVVISLIIIKSGLELILGSVSDMLGLREEKNLTSAVKDSVAKEDGVYGIYDLLIHDYGPDKHLASVHIEIDKDKTAEQIDLMSRNIQERVFSETGVIIAAVGIYSRNNDDSEVSFMCSDIRKLVCSHEGVLQFHGFYADLEKKRISFDVILDFAVDRKALYEHIYSDVKKEYEDYELRITLDSDVSD